MEHVASGLSYSEAADAINAKFGTRYSRSAALGRARRMHLFELERPRPCPLTAPGGQGRPRERTADDFRPLEFFRRPPVFVPVGLAPLRCVAIEPRHLTLVELERGDCRYPYGGDEEGEAITFCGHPRRKGTSYCTPHFHLSRNPEVPAARTAGGAPLRIVETAWSFNKPE